MGDPGSEELALEAARCMLASVEIVRRAGASTTAALVAWAVLIALVLLFDRHFAVAHKVGCKVGEARSDVRQDCWPGSTRD